MGDAGLAGRMVTEELVAAGIPAVVVDDFNINLTMYSREPMSRIFVTEDRQAEARELVGRKPQTLKRLDADAELCRCLSKRVNLTGKAGNRPDAAP